MSDFGLQAIRARIHAIDPATANAGTIAHLGSTAEFEPFGETYLAALEQRDRLGHSPPGATSVQLGSASSTHFSAAHTTAARATAVPGRSTQPVAGTPGIAGMPGLMSSGIPGIPGVDDAKVAAAIAGQAAPLGARPPGGYGSLLIPDTLRALGNGKVPQSALVEISQGNHRLYAPAAASWNNLVATARAEGIELRITDSYRSYDEQVDLARRKGLYSEGGLAATPGTSNHGWGMAVDADVTDTRTREWLQINGPRFGWIESVPREPWHWEFRPAQV